MASAGIRCEAHKDPMYLLKKKRKKKILAFIGIECSIKTIETR